jgi:hypothetical protein
MGEIRNAYNIFAGKPEVGSCGLDSSGSGYGTVVGSCEHGNEPSGSIKVGNLVYLSDY